MITRPSQTETRSSSDFFFRPTLLLIFIVWVWVLCSLISYSEHDPSLLHILIPFQPAQNWAGSWGAHIAALWFFIGGGAGWSIAALPLVYIRSYISGSSLKGGVVQLLMMNFAIASLCRTFHFSLVAPFQGGVMGMLGAWCTSPVGIVGSVIVWGGCVLAVLVWFFHPFFASFIPHYSFSLPEISWPWDTTGWGVSFRQYHFSAPTFLKKITTIKEVTSLSWYQRAKKVISHPFVGAASAVVNACKAAMTRKKPSSTPAESQSSSDTSFQEKTAASTSSSADRVKVTTTLMPSSARLGTVSPRTHDPSTLVQKGSEVSQDVHALTPLAKDLRYPEQEDVRIAEGQAVREEPALSHEYEPLMESETEYEEAVVYEDEGSEDDYYEEEVYEEDESLYDDTDEESQESNIAPFYLPEIDELFERHTAHDHRAALLASSEERGRVLEEKLSHFGINGKVVAIQPGPVVTLFEYEPEVNMKISKIIALEDDLALSLRALSIRIIAPIPGKNVVGFEIANEKRHPVYLTEVMTKQRLFEHNRKLPVTLGVDTTGNPVVGDLATMPHLLVAGSTGSGKSVGMNVMLVSLLCSKTPDQLRLILIDPKRLEFAPYADIPHLLFPIITDPSQVSPVLTWVVQEMEARYDILAKAGVRNVSDYHALDASVRAEYEKGRDVKGMPYIVVMIDELADLMMVAGKDIEMLIARIAQMARAAGIHMIVATQRPSVDVVTGIIKVNFPSRIAFRVSSKVDSRTIVDGVGAEKLLGKGDMLYMSPSSAMLRRLHGPYIPDEEIERLTTHLKEQRPVRYLSLQKIIARQRAHDADNTLDDPLYQDVCNFLKTVDEVSISMLQRKYRVGFNRSARIIEMLEQDGYVAPAQGGKPRRVLRS